MFIQYNAVTCGLLLTFFLFLLCMEQLPQINPGFNNTPFKFTKYSNAYMLVYIRESDKEKIMCNVDEKDIAEHLRVSSSCILSTFSLYHLSIFVEDSDWLNCSYTDKVEERTRRERAQEEGEGWSSSLHYHKGLLLFQSYQQLTSLLVTPPDRTLFMKNENRLLEMRI